MLGTGQEICGLDIVLVHKLNSLLSVCCSFWCSGTGKRFSNRKETICLPLPNARFDQGLWNRISSRPNARWQADWAIEDQTKNLNSVARPYDQRAFSPLDPNAGWLSHSDFRIERRQVVFLCWMQNSNPGSLEPNPHQPECPLTDIMGYRWSI